MEGSREAKEHLPELTREQVHTAQEMADIQTELEDEVHVEGGSGWG